MASLAIFKYFTDSGLNRFFIQETMLQIIRKVYSIGMFLILENENKRLLATIAFQYLNVSNAAGSREKASPTMIPMTSFRRVTFTEPFYAITRGNAIDTRAVGFESFLRRIPD